MNVFADTPLTRLKDSNFLFIKILAEEKYATTNERLMRYAEESFQRLLPKLQIEVNVFNGYFAEISPMFQGCVPMDIPCQISEPNAMATSDMDLTVQKLFSFLSKQKQVF